LDEVIVTLFRAPNSYTREDVVEISCHGGSYISRKILELVVERGARIARPGEFTQRAFLNGRLDLSQAEAVAEIIRAKTELSLKAALSQFQGVLSRYVKDIRQNLIEICSLLELELDFAEEDVEFADRSEIETKLQKATGEIKSFLSTYDRGKILREGAKLVIVGKPNVGKSSLMNALLKEERAIVTDIPGTTRDVLEEQLDIRGVLFRVVDTAGFRESKDKVEREGVRRTTKKIQEADIIIFLFDGSEPLSVEDVKLVEQVFSIRNKTDGLENGFAWAINKIDLERKITISEIRKQIGESPILEISAKEHLGFRELEDTLIKLALGNESYDQDEPVVTNIRQRQALLTCLESLAAARSSLAQGLSSEFVALDLRAALEQLGEIIGEVTSEDILNNIFSKFCIGK
jgi:tRNA modification GTPase